jgi:hypothetical protein
MSIEFCVVLNKYRVILNKKTFPNVLYDFRAIQKTFLISWWQKSFLIYFSYDKIHFHDLLIHFRLCCDVTILKK